MYSSCKVLKDKNRPSILLGFRWYKCIYLIIKTGLSNIKINQILYSHPKNVHFISFCKHCLYLIINSCWKIIPIHVTRKVEAFHITEIPVCCNHNDSSSHSLIWNMNQCPASVSTNNMQSAKYIYSH